MKLLKKLIINLVLFVAGGLAVKKLLWNEDPDLESIASLVLLSLLITFVADRVINIFFKQVAKWLYASLPETELASDERAIKVDRASHYKGSEAVGGRLVLTNKRLIFQSHKFNIQNHRTEMPITEIRAVEQKHGNDKMLQIRLSNSETHKFIVDSAPEWVNLIPHT
ncbi:MAG: GRAM domain-containing protein [Bacteroidota bacterium]